MNNFKTMNRLLLASASVFAIGFGSAAVAAGGGGAVHLSQSGNSQSAQIDQSGGSANSVGSSGSPFVQQNGAGSGSNVLVINQNSSANSQLSNIESFMAEGSNNSVTGFQSGTNNSAEIDQGGSYSSVHLEQTGNGNGPPDSNWFNESFGNLILQDQTTNGSSVSLIQTNKVNATNANVFSIGQGGTSNTIAATQTGNNMLWIRQGTEAPDLWGWTWGNPFDPAETPNSLAALAHSSIIITQTVGGSDPAQKNYAALGQGYGSNNQIVVTQTGGSNSVDVNQIGSGNIFTSSQTSSNGNANWNFVGGEAGWPNSDPFPLSEQAGDYRPIAQIGTGNEYHSVQSGMSQLAFGNQLGDYNYLSTTQSGEGNSLYTTQAGNNNDIFSVQDGTTNTALVTQNNNASLTNLVQDGTNNSAVVAQ